MYPQNHDMDDLFRKAAARYPLVARNGDWDAVAARLKFPGEPMAGKVNFRSRKDYLLLILIPAAFLFHNSSIDRGHMKVTDKNVLAYIPPVQDKITNPDSSIANDRHIKATGHSFMKAVSINDPQRNNHMAASLPKPVAYTGGSVNTGGLLRGKPFTISVQTPDKSKPPGAQSGLYLGTVAGLDFANVKGQDFTSPGFNLGIQVGYRFNRRWSVETGISWIQKKYFTNGEYFSMQKLESSMPGMEMITVKGRLSLIELTYKLKYDFLLRPRSNFFVTAGGSSNLYIRESNEYYMRQNGIYESHEASYRDVNCSPLCLAHVSVGYERSLRNKTSIRLEPYIKIPLGKVGMGSVPLMSVGLNISISNPLGRRAQ